MLKRRFAKVSIVAIIFIVASSFVGYGTMIYSTAQTPPEKELITVGILDPDYGDTISGEIMIRAIILHSHPSWGYTISVLLNGTEISSSVPFEWDTTPEDDGWWNITVRVTDTHGNFGQDTVVVYVDNTPDMEVEILQILSTSRSGDVELPGKSPPNPPILSIDIIVSEGSKLFCIATIGSLMLVRPPSYTGVIGYYLSLMLDDNIELMSIGLYRRNVDVSFECVTLHGLSNELSEGSHNIKLVYGWIIPSEIYDYPRLRINWAGSDTVLTVMEIAE